MNFFRTLTLTALMMLSGALAFAQNNVTAALIDASTGEAVGFATASLTKTGATKPAKYVLSTQDGLVNIEQVKNGEYTFKVELLGYKPYTKSLTMEGKEIDLGEIKLELDSEQLDAASVSAVGNPIVIKKDTIEYNATSFKTTENDMLEDLLKKLPGVEIDDNGGITVNGETISKITIDGKTFFLDDPTVASKNLPAKLINKLKVIKKKSEQAEFTGIDDGEEENVIDLSVKPGMMQGLIGNVNAGAGKDIPSEINTNNDFRYAGNAFLGRFTDKSNISLILNANNGNNLGSTNRSGNMMAGMMGGGMGGMMGGGMSGGQGSNSGITTSEMIGFNAAYDLFDDRMELGGNYMFNHSDNVAVNNQYKKTYLDDYNLLANTAADNTNFSRGHNIGIRLEHEFSENTSIIFEPQINFGDGGYGQLSSTTTNRENHEDTGSSTYKLNESSTDNTGSNKNLSTSGMFIFRQRLGIPGRTLTAMARYSFSNNDMVGVNYNNTKTFDEAGQTLSDVTVDQSFTNNQKSTSLMGRLTYTEPMGDNFYLEGNYAYNYSKTNSEKVTIDNATGLQDYTYSNKVINESGRHEIGANVLFQKPTFRAQIGFTAQPTHTYNSTYAYDTTTQQYSPREYIDDRWNFSPQAMVLADFNDNSNMRIFYRGQSQQPSTSQLMPVPDNTDPLNISFGNPSLTPYFTHNMNIEFRNSNKEKFSSVTLRVNGSLTQNPIVNVAWQGDNGARYTMPFNGKSNMSAGLNSFINTPIAKSDFSINNNFRFNWSLSNSYAANNVDMSKYPDPLEDYYGFMDAFIADHKDLNNNSDFTPYSTNSLSFNEELRAKYSNDYIEITLGAGTNMRKTWYSVSSLAGQTTWANLARADVVWTWDATGISLDLDYRFRWYNGYDTDQPNRHLLNAEISKLLFNNKVTLSVRGTDILGQQRSFSVSDVENYHTETTNNTLGRYIIVSIAYRFGTFGRGNRNRGGGPMGGGPMGGPGGGGPGGGPMGPPPGMR